MGFYHSLINEKAGALHKNAPYLAKIQEKMALKCVFANLVGGMEKIC